MAIYVRRFDELGLDDVALVGGKTASLAELSRALGPRGVRVPGGFAITAAAYWALLDSARLRPRLAELFEGLAPGDVNDLSARAKSARAWILGTPLPADVWRDIREAYVELSNGIDADVAVRSSATAEDLPEASFAGQQETFLHVRGLGLLEDAVRRCFASLYTDRAVAYRMDHGIGHESVALSVAVQHMVRADLGSAGVMFTLDTETGFRDVVTIEAAWGIGEGLVQGDVDPDSFCVFKPTLRAGKRAILRRRVGAKQTRVVYADSPAGPQTRAEPVADEWRARLCLTDDEVLTLARWALWAEEHYSARAGTPRPMDLEWAKDGRTGLLYLLQARPETVEARRPVSAVLERAVLKREGQVLARGRSVGRAIAAGPPRVVRDVRQLDLVRDGDVLVAEMTTPDWEPVLRRVAAVVTDRGGRTCHAAIVARELGIPAVVGTGEGTRVLAHASAVTVDCASGDEGRVFDGVLPFRTERLDLGSLPRTRTRLELNVGEPGRAFGLAALPSDGVGLARIEFVLTSAIGVHPLALLHPERLDPATRAAVDRLTIRYADRAEFFVERLAEGVGTIAAAFFPRPVVVRLGDLRSNEYARLLGGAPFEPTEENPMLGLRGAARYTHPLHGEAFALECRAIERVRGELGLTNVRVMVPFCRSVAEGRRVLEAMARHGLARGEAGLEVYVMCEIPSNALLIDAFAELFDGVSIGSNDLTQLTLGVDRDSALVASAFDERDPAVTTLLRLAVEGALRHGKHVGICGQAPSDHPEVAELLVRMGITSLSLSPDSLVATWRHVAEVERRLGVLPGAEHARPKADALAKPWHDELAAPPRRAA